ncbi:DNA primase [Streptomyces sp. NPDC053367]|uniref:DNA primase n=1 Tax=Streptomyces sp. NPDC053367 TaxID=3365700 RepID=UPI0037D63067
MNRAGLGLAIGAGYLLGRTRKLKLAVAVGTFVAGRRMNLGPGTVVDLVSRQLRENPQFKELGDQLRGDLRGVGKAASSAMIERQLDALAGRLHDRTAETRDRLAGVLPDGEESAQDEEEAPAGGTRSDKDREPDAAEPEEDDAAQARDTQDAEETAEEDSSSEASGSRSRARKTTAPAKKAGARKTAAKKTARGAKAAGSAARTASGARRPKGGGDR